MFKKKKKKGQALQQESTEANQCIHPFKHPAIPPAPVSSKRVHLRSNRVLSHISSKGNMNGRKFSTFPGFLLQGISLPSFPPFSQLKIQLNFKGRKWEEKKKTRVEKYNVHRAVLKPQELFWPQELLTLYPITVLLVLDKLWE